MSDDRLLAALRPVVAGGSERQWTDLLGLLRAQRGRLDLDYLRRWAADLQADALLERALTAADAT
jgi:hypothetical protein